MGRDHIVFIGPYIHLSYPLYRAITPFMVNKYKLIFLELHDPISNSYGVINLVNKASFLEYFDTYLDIRENNLKKNEGKFSIFNFLINLKNHLTYQNRIYGYLSKTNPRAIISTSDSSVSDRIAAKWANKNNIPFIIIQPSLIDGFLSDKSSSSEKIKSKLNYIIKYWLFTRLLKYPLSAKQNYYGNEDPHQYLLLWSKYFISNPTRPNTIITGNPVFDKLFLLNTSKRTKNNQVLICTQDIDQFWGWQKYLEVLDIYKKLISSFPKIHFYMKIHPREPLEKYNSVFSQNEFPNLTITKDKDLHSLIEICDVQISVNSYTSLQAAAMGKVIITIQPKWLQIENNDFLGEEISIELKSKEDAKSVMKKAMSDKYWMDYMKKRKNYFSKIFFSDDTQSSSRVAENIEKIISSVNKS